MNRRQTLFLVGVIGLILFIMVLMILGLNTSSKQLSFYALDAMLALMLALGILYPFRKKFGIALKKFDAS